MTWINAIVSIAFSSFVHSKMIFFLKSMILTILWGVLVSFLLLSTNTINPEYLTFGEDCVTAKIKKTQIFQNCNLFKQF